MYEKHGGEDHIGKQVSQLEQMGQAGQLPEAETANRPYSLVQNRGINHQQPRRSRNDIRIWLVRAIFFSEIADILIRSVEYKVLYINSWCEDEIIKTRIYTKVKINISSKKTVNLASINS